jgi:N-acetylglucosamine-6-phosphate deacetylase
MASANPADFLRLDQVTGRIMPGLQADLVLLDDGGQVLRCWIAGSAG